MKELKLNIEEMKLFDELCDTLASKESSHVKKVKQSNVEELVTKYKQAIKKEFDGIELTDEDWAYKNHCEGLCIRYQNNEKLTKDEYKVIHRLNVKKRSKEEKDFDNSLTTLHYDFLANMYCMINDVNDMYKVPALGNITQEILYVYSRHDECVTPEMDKALVNFIVYDHLLEKGFNKPLMKDGKYKTSIAKWLESVMSFYRNGLLQARTEYQTAKEAKSLKKRVVIELNDLQKGR